MVETKFIYSDITGKSFPVLAQASKLVPEERNVQRVYVISPEDLLAYNADLAGEMEQERAYYEERITRSQYNDFLNTYDHQIDDVFRRFLNENYPELSGLVSDESLVSVYNFILRGDAATWEFDTDITDSHNCVALIITPYADQTKEGYAATVTGLPSEGFENLPGTDENWRAATILHEIAHISQDGFSANLRHEVMADIHEGKILSGLFNSTVIQDLEEAGPDVFDARQAVRAIASFNGNTAESHITNAAVQSNNEGPAPKGRIVDFQDALINAQKLVHREIGENINSLASYVAGAGNLIDGVEVTEGYGTVVITPEDEKILKNMIGSPTQMFDFINGLSEAARDAFYFNVLQVDEWVGQKSALNNPAILYEKTRELYLKGSFDDNPIGKQYAYEYLKAAQEYVPEIHGADIDEVFIPPQFDEQGQHAAALKVEL